MKKKIRIDIELDDSHRVLAIAQAVLNGVSVDIAIADVDPLVVIRSELTIAVTEFLNTSWHFKLVDEHKEMLPARYDDAVATRMSFDAIDGLVNLIRTRLEEQQEAAERNHEVACDED